MQSCTAEQHLQKGNDDNFDKIRAQEIRKTIMQTNI